MTIHPDSTGGGGGARDTGRQGYRWLAIRGLPQHWWAEGPENLCRRLRVVLEAFGTLELQPQLLGVGAIAAFEKPESARSAVEALHGKVCEIELRPFDTVGGAAMLPSAEPSSSTASLMPTKAADAAHVHRMSGHHSEAVPAPVTPPSLLETVQDERCSQTSSHGAAAGNLVPEEHGGSSNPFPQNYFDEKLRDLKARALASEGKLRTPSVSPLRPQRLAKKTGRRSLSQSLPGKGAEQPEVETPSLKRRASIDGTTPPWKLRRRTFYEGEEDDRGTLGAHRGGDAVREARSMAIPRSLGAQRSQGSDCHAQTSSSRSSQGTNSVGRFKMKELKKGNHVRAVMCIRYKDGLVVPVNTKGIVVDVDSAQGIGINWQGFETLNKAVVKREQVEKVCPIVAPVREVAYTQDSIGANFKDGRPLQDLIEQLLSGEVDPLKADFLELPAIKVGHKLRSQANRRLHCLKKYQEKVDHEVKVRLLVIRPSDPVMRRFMACFTSECGGRYVAIRHRPGAGQVSKRARTSRTSTWRKMLGK